MSFRIFKKNTLEELVQKLRREIVKTTDLKTKKIIHNINQ